MWLCSILFAQKKLDNICFLFNCHITFIFMHLADAFIQSDLQCIQDIHFCQYVCSRESNPQPFTLLTQCSNHRATGTITFSFDCILND